MAKIIQFPSGKRKKSHASKANPQVSSNTGNMCISSDVTMTRLMDEINRLEKLSDIPRKIMLLNQAISRVSKDENPFLWGALNNEFAVTLCENPLGDRADNIEEAIRYCEQALEVRTRDAMPVEWAETMMNLANAFIYRISEDRADNIEEAIQYYEQVLEVIPRDAMPVEWAETMMNIANAFYSRVLGDRVGNIEKAIRYYEQSLEVMNRDAMSVQWAAAMMNLAVAHTDRIRGNRADNIEEAIRCLEQALEVTTRDAMPVEWAEAMMNMAASYYTRIRGDRVGNIEEAVRCFKQALDVMRRDDMPIQWATIMMNLAVAYTNRIRGDHADNIEEAIRCCEQALEVITQDAIPGEWALIMVNLAAAYEKRIRGNRADNIEEAIRCCEQALKVMNRDAMSVEWAKTRMTLAVSYKERLHGDRADNIEEAIRCCEQVLKVMNRDAMPVEWAETRMTLANALYYRIRGRREDNIEAAIRCNEGALEMITRDAMPSDYRKIKQNLGNICLSESRWRKAVNAYTEVLEASEISYKAAAIPESRQYELREVRGMAARLAFSLIKRATSVMISDAIKEAVVSLERNRARWLSEALALKNEKPEAVPNTVWNDFDESRKKYNELLAESRLPEDTPGRRQFLELGAVMRKASETLETLVSKFREYESAFMPDPNFDQIRESVSSPSEAMIYFAVTPVGSAVFIIRTVGGPPFYILLDDLTEDKLIKQTLYYLVAYDEWRGNPKKSEACNNWEKAIDSTTNRLWDWFMGPLTEKLVTSGISHAILIPQGYLGILPLHAAWTAENGKRRYAMDDVCYTYAPNALSLAASRETARKALSERVLAIDEPYTENASSLPNSNVEVAAICRHFTKKTVLSDIMATRTNVRNTLPDHDVFHFSCHGMADVTEPLDSGLLMANNETLTLRDFLSKEGVSARLAVLSACETGIPDIRNADEAISLPSGLMQAGVAGVVASLWSVSDLSTMMLMVRFYEIWREDNLEPPEALRQAQIWVRDTPNGEKAEYFGGFLPEFDKTGSQRLPVHVADMLYKASASSRPDENDFEHPFYWAAFGYTGL